MKKYSKFEVEIKNVVTHTLKHQFALVYFSVTYVDGCISDDSGAVDSRVVQFPSQLISCMDCSGADDLPRILDNITMVLSAIREWFGLYPTDAIDEPDETKHHVTLTVHNLDEFSKVLGAFLKDRTMYQFIRSGGLPSSGAIDFMVQSCLMHQPWVEYPSQTVENDYTSIPKLPPFKVMLDRTYAIATSGIRDLYTLAVTQVEMPGVREAPELNALGIQPTVITFAERGGCDVNSMISDIEPEICRIMRMAVLFSQHRQGYGYLLPSPLDVLGKCYYDCIPGLFYCEIERFVQTYRIRRKTLELKKNKTTTTVGA